MLTIFLPNNVNFILLNNNFIYLYNLNYFLLLNLTNYNIFYNNNLNTIKLQKNTINNKILDKNFINNFLFTWENFFFSKIYFLGKGFKLRKFKKTIYFNFNYSHINFIIYNKTLVKKIQKNKILIFCKDIRYLNVITNIITNIKKISPYTKRGLRRSKQIIYKKKNKSNV